ncbi:MAG: lysophospholipid acyltransferase family protein [Verrucomicrobia bacterium]|nr:lysophospholipid acyltransferase family protein [Verrucomicrobiota bacterium]
MTHRPKHILEYALLRLIGAVVTRLPHRAALTTGWLLAGISFCFAPNRRREAHRRIRAVFGDRHAAPTIRRIAWCSWRNIVFDGIEMLRVRHITPAWIEKSTNCAAAVVPILAHTPTGRGAIIAIPHMGNWETAAVAAHHAGIPIFSVTGRQKNQLVDNYINRLRRLPGIDTIARGSGTMRAVIRRLRSGGVLAIMTDVRTAEGGLPITFLGSDALIGAGMASFARLADVPIFPCVITRVGWLRQRMQVSDPIWPDPSLAKNDDIRRMTQLVMSRFDTWIREAPEQWFWYNRRWVLDPLPPASAPGAKP